MEFDTEFKNKCYNAFSSDRENIRNIMSSLEKGQELYLRGIMEDSIDSLKDSICTIIGFDEERIHNAKVHEYNTRMLLYSELIEKITKLNNEYEYRSLQKKVLILVIVLYQHYLYHHLYILIEKKMLYLMLLD